MTVHQRAREAAMPVECKKDVLKQNQDGTWKLTLTIAPDGLPDEIMRAMPGTRYQTAFVEVGDGEEPVAKAPPAASEKPRTPFRDRPLSQQAGIRCGDINFGTFLCERYPDRWISGLDIANEDNTEAAALIVRNFCNVDSRASLDDEVYPTSRRAWLDLNTEYEQWAGLTAESR